MVILINAENAFDRIPKIFRVKGKFLSLIKGIH
jgi:hypothetical protein